MHKAIHLWSQHSAERQEDQKFKVILSHIVKASLGYMRCLRPLASHFRKINLKLQHAERLVPSRKTQALGHTGPPSVAVSCKILEPFPNGGFAGCSNNQPAVMCHLTPRSSTATVNSGVTRMGLDLSNHFRTSSNLYEI